MQLNNVFKILENKIDVFRGIDFAYMLLTEDLVFKKFEQAEDLERYANVQPEDKDQIVMRVHEDGTGRSFFVWTVAYTALIIDDGKNLSLNTYRKRLPEQEIQNIQPDYEKAKKEIESYFTNATVETKKLAS